MRSIIKKTAAVFAAAAMMTASAACSSEKKDDDHDHTHAMIEDDISDDVQVNQEDLPYGATMTSLKAEHNDKVKIDIDFDSRYFVQEGDDYPEIILLTEYLDAMQKHDSDALSKIYYKPYLDDFIKTGKFADVSDYISKYMDNLEEKTGSQPEFTYAVVDTCLNENESETLTDFGNVDKQLDELTGEKISDKIKSRKLIYMDVSIKDSQDNSYMFNNTLGYDISVYIYNIDGTYYLV